ncbi:hypothetical protein PAXRUDRAFT_834233 [Paxillus rubicundulus Ve08.2h10]|uniref:DNA polymerase delta subunit 4 n=1 Tax=Paxillus rubicundulus Ve08.2h10 TaxID=930991 RepID=A0A0D0C889_9AGAM|nr:hypothetical protein PAXRUDRAFT_834233 [Paxillus rubicundulus Ve08.2h10]
MKQGTLSFASAKRTNSLVNVNSKKPAALARSSSSAVDKEKIKPAEIFVQVQRDTQGSGIVDDISSEEEYAPAQETTVPAKRTRSRTKAHLSSSMKNASSKTSRSESTPAPVGAERKHLDVEDKAGCYRRYYNEVRSRMGYIQPIHGEGQNQILQMLRFFDMSYEFGPCIGMTRLERWERAEAFGLNPPVEVREILLTKEGTEKEEYAQCVLYGEV